ncbi:hypothetical protein J2Y00_001071 [Deinococcus soli (ex Cha et al. 2016)]|uniref:Uncharacterized protein n=1 Tax=Deinococcus soli (ex Cha et al. 2016) TaxID=1309411 RepID=A0AAE3XAV9_9DEIO|nr:hypothetical protein [Deinococcus soli (ex Cha et al. 2016)]MDR6326823.1 hypothetical protein [Deinococcus soli (ex Cha et al. 2016)]
MVCQNRSFRAEASGSKAGSGRGVGHPVTFRVADGTDGIRITAAQDNAGESGGAVPLSTISVGGGPYTAEDE